MGNNLHDGILGGRCDIEWAEEESIDREKEWRDWDRGIEGIGEERARGGEWIASTLKYIYILD